MRQSLLTFILLFLAGIYSAFGQCSVSISGPTGMVCTGDQVTLTASTNGPAPGDCAQSVNISNTTTTVTCGQAICFYDSGGPNGNYSTSESYIHTFTSNSNAPVTITFLSANGETCCDYITIYDGVGTGGTQLHYGLLSTVNGNATFTSTGASITVKFTSDGSVCYNGWQAIVSCDACSDYTYTWSNGMTGPTITVAPASETTYTVTAEAAGCCTATNSITISPANCTNLCNDFETSADRAEWTLVNSGQTNQWVIGTAVNNGGQYSLYISDNPTAATPANNYTISSTSNVWAYKDIEFPECDDNYELSFDWKAYGESCCDYIKVYIGDPAAVTAGSTTQPTGSTLLNSTNFNVQSTWQHVQYTLASATYSGQIKRLYFLWHNDGSVGTQPPAAIDNVCIQACIPCDQPVVNVVPESAVLCQGESVTITASATGGAGNYTFEWSPATGLNTTTGTTVTASPQTTTTYTLRVTDGADCAKSVRVPVEISGTTLSITQSPAVYCRGTDPVTLNADLNVSGSCSNYTYQWSNGPSGAISTDVPQQNTTYTVTATPVGGDCCTLTATHTVEVGDCNQECDDFETAAGRAEWTLVNSGQTNQWVIGTAVNNGGQYSLYISDNPTAATPANNYTISSTSNVWAYKDIEFPECDDNYELSFDWKAYGESCCDYIKVYIGDPAAVTAGSTTQPTGSTLLNSTNFNVQSTWQHVQYTLASATYSGQIKRLYFLWHNDGSVGTQPPAAIDNVCIQACIPCDQPVVNVVPESAVLCQGESVTITASATGGAGNYTFEWSPATGLNTTTGTTVTASPQTTTTYTLRVTDGADCAKSVRVPVEISGTTLSITQSPAVYCRGTDPVTLNADLNVSGSCSNYTYQWSNGPSGAISTDVPQQNTTYTVTATPVGGDCCTLTATHTVEVGDCNQDCDDFETAAGRAEWTLVNGSQTNKWTIGTATNNGGQYSLYVSDNATSTTPPNTYSNTLSDSWAYKEIEFPECDEDFVISFDWKSYGESCCDYMYVYLAPASSTVTAGSATAPAGALQFTNPTTTSVKFNMSNTWQHFEITLDNVEYSGQLCNLYFYWHNDGSVGTAPPAAVDNICIQACVPCDQPVVEVTPASVILCQGASTTFTATATGGAGGDYTFTWSPGESLNTTDGPTVTASPQETTVYRVRVVDTLGCAKTVRVTAEISGTRLNVTANPAGYCIGQNQDVTVTANLTVSGSCSQYTYLWSTMASGTTIHVSPDVTTEYTVTATPADPACCELIASTTVAVMDCQADGCPSVTPAELGTNNPEIMLDCATQQDVTLCANVLATAVEADDYFVFSIPYAPPYGFTDGNRIFANATDDTWSSVVNLPFTFCYYGHTYNQIVAGANSVTTFNTSVAGNSCAWSYDESIPSTSLFPNTIFACYRDIYPSTSDYVPTTGDGGIFEGVLGQYPCRSYVLSFNNIKLFSCTEIRTFSTMIVLYEGTNIIDIYVRDAPTCTSWNDGNGVIGLQNFDGTAGITPPGRNTGPWTAHQEAWRFMPTGQPSYDVTWYLGTDTSANGQVLGHGDLLTVAPEETTYYTARLRYTACNGDFFDITNVCHVTVNNERPELHVFASKDTLCPEEAVTITAASEDVVSYVWNTGDTVPSFTLVPEDVVTTYAVTTTYSNGCTRSDSVTVYAVATIAEPTFLRDPVEICAGDPATITSENEYAVYRWNTGGTGRSITVTPPVTTTYSLTVSDEVGCQASAETEIIVHPSPLAAFSPESYLNFLEEGSVDVQFLDFSEHAASWIYDFDDQWSNANTSDEPSPIHTYTHSGIYNVTQWVTSDFGCMDSVTHYVSVQKPFYFYIPNSFTPDGDGMNEIWRPLGEGVDESNYVCTVFDRNGRMIFRTTSLTQGWDGTDHGKPVPVAAYVYVIQTNTMDGVPKEFVGTVTVIR